MRRELGGAAFWEMACRIADSIDPSETQESILARKIRYARHDCLPKEDRNALVPSAQGASLAGSYLWDALNVESVIRELGQGGEGRFVPGFGFVYPPAVVHTALCQLKHTTVGPRKKALEEGASQKVSPNKKEQGAGDKVSIPASLKEKNREAWSSSAFFTAILPVAEAEGLNALKTLAQTADQTLHWSLKKP